MLAQPESLEISVADRSVEDSKAVVNQARDWNREHGFQQETAIAPKTEVTTNWLARHVSQPLGKAWASTIGGPLERTLTRHFPKQVKPRQPAAGNVGVIYLSLSQAPAEGKDVVVTFDRKKRGIEYIGFAKGDKGFKIIEGERLVFNAKNWSTPAMAVIQLDPKLKQDAAVMFQANSGNIPLAWSITLFAVAALFLAFSCWHSVMLPRPVNDVAVVTNKSFVGEFLSTLGSFFPQTRYWLGAGFYPPVSIRRSSTGEGHFTISAGQPGSRRVRSDHQPGWAGVWHLRNSGTHRRRIAGRVHGCQTWTQEDCCRSWSVPCTCQSSYLCCFPSSNRKTS